MKKQGGRDTETPGGCYEGGVSMGRISVLSAQSLAFHKKCNQGQCFKVSLCGSICIYIYIYIYLLPHMDTHARAHTHTHTHTHISLI